MSDPCPYCNAPAAGQPCSACGTATGTARPAKSGVPFGRTIASEGAEEIGRRGLSLVRYGYDDKPEREGSDDE